MTESIFDGTFKRLKIEEVENITIPSDNPFDEQLFKEYLSLLLKNGNLILTGAPGTGKTFLAKSMAASIVGQCAWDELTPEQKKRCGFVQFHPSYDYTDFVEGLRPESDGSFARRDGVFKDFCKTALKSDGKECVFIIDEINRGELSKIFGELFYSIEPDYRGPEGTVLTQYNEMVKNGDEFKDGFFIPDNVYIIGTMNDVDRGVEAMDFAVRRRFVWREITAEESAINMGIVGDAYVKMKAVNDALSKAGLSDAFHIGGAYFRKLDDKNFSDLWNLRLRCVISEYFRGEPDAKDKIQSVENAYFMAKAEATQNEV
ncbi:MAG: AAA family ATPase [Bacteroidales bacterium]|nr:AAA family ATPase [Bacteroidales bacterium]